MLPDDIKKLLHDLKMDDVVRELEGEKAVDKQTPAIENHVPRNDAPPIPEPAPQPEPQVATQHVAKQHIAKRHIPKRAVLLVGLLILALIPAAYLFWRAPQQEESLIASNDAEVDEVLTRQQEREEAAAAWATKIVQMDQQTGSSVHLLWDMLRRRKEDLEEVTQALANLLYDNARLREDMYAPNAELLMKHYLAIDRRHAFEIASQINAISSQIKGKNNHDLSRAYAEMLGELGAECYTKRQLQMARELLEQEGRVKETL